MIEGPTLPPVENPLGSLTGVSLAPVSVPSEYADRKWTEQLRGALLRVDNLDNVPLVPWSMADRKSRKLPELGADSQALLHLTVIEFDPYYPPSATVEVDFYIGHQALAPEMSIIEMERHGRPLGAKKQGPRSPWIRFQRVVNLTDPKVARRLARYAEAQGDNDRGLAGVDRVARVSDRYMDFVLHDTVQECFARISNKEKETDGSLRKLLAGSVE